MPDLKKRRSWNDECGMMNDESFGSQALPFFRPVNGAWNAPYRGVRNDECGMRNDESFVPKALPFFCYRAVGLFKLNSSTA